MLLCTVGYWYETEEDNDYSDCHVIGLYNRLIDIIPDIPKLKRFENFQLNNGKIYTENEIINGEFVGENDFSPESVSFDYYVDINNGISPMYSRSRNNFEARDPIIIADSLKELDTELRKYINSKEQMQSFVRNTKLPVDIGKNVYSFLKFGNKNRNRKLSRRK